MDEFEGWQDRNIRRCFGGYIFKYQTDSDYRMTFDEVFDFWNENVDYKLGIFDKVCDTDTDTIEFTIFKAGYLKCLQELSPIIEDRKIIEKQLKIYLNATKISLILVDYFKNSRNKE